MTSASPPPTASVVIASRDRPRLLEACLTALQNQGVGLEVVVVDDGSETPYAEVDAIARMVDVLVTSSGLGPSAARNAGVAASSGDILLFTDDDTAPDVTWARAAVAWLEANPEAGGVEGPTESPPFDPLYEHSVVAIGAGHYYTCNVAYRRGVFDAVGGFDAAAFPRFREDRDLGYRALELGPIGYVDGMRVVHAPRAFDLRWTFSSHAASEMDVKLAERHPDYCAWSNGLPRLLQPVSGTVRSAAGLVSREFTSRRSSARRRIRAVAVGATAIIGCLCGVARFARRGSRPSQLRG